MSMPVMWRMLWGIACAILGSIGALLVLAGITVLTIHFTWLGLILTVSLAIAVMLYLIIKVLLRDRRGPVTVLRLGFDQPMYEHECPTCEGVCVLTLVDGVWGPIPVEWRITQPGSRIFHPPLANKMTCTGCQGRGTILLPYPPKKARNAG